MAEHNRVTRVLSEGVVIVVSILLAFWIDAWWDERQARSAEAAIIKAVHEEALANGASLDRTLEINRADLERVDMFLASTPGELEALPVDSVRPWLAALAVAWTYDGDLSATSLILDSSIPVTARGFRVRDLAARWLRVLEDGSEEKGTLWALATDVTGRFALLAAPGAVSGKGSLPGKVARRGASALVELRQNEPFLAAALHKVHFQALYLAELDQASAVLDSLEAAAR